MPSISDLSRRGDAAKLVHHARPAMRQHHGGLALLDKGGAGDLLTGGQGRAIVDLGRAGGEP